MTYRTFILIRNSVGAGLVALAGFGVMKGCASVAQNTPRSSNSEVTTPRRDAPRKTNNSRPTSVAAATASSYPARQQLAALERKVIGFSKEALTNGSSDGSSRKWRIKEDRITVELRSDTGKGSTTWNRLKVDLDRDKNWDEAWDLKPGKPIKRRIAPADDENYTVTYDLQGETWVRREK
jgi:hypothetical protein